MRAFTFLFYNSFTISGNLVGYVWIGEVKPILIMKLFKKPQYGKNLHAFTFLFTIHLQCVATQLRTFA